MKQLVAASLTLLLSIAAPAAEPVWTVVGLGPNAPKQPQIAVAHDGNVHLVFGIGQRVVHARSTDGGRTFSTPKPVADVPNLSLGRRRGPRVAVTDAAIVVTAIGGPQGKGRDGDLQAWRSIDGGLHWTGPVRVNDVEASAREGLHGMASGPDGSVWCTWLDLRTKSSEVYAARSLDGGLTWQPNICVYRSPDGHVCECCHPSIAVDSRGVRVLFRNWLDGQRDMYVVSSNDGVTFGGARKLGEGSWKLDACPMDGGMIATDPQGELVTAWRRDRQVYLARVNASKEQLLGPGEQPWIASTAGGPVVVWTGAREGDLWLKEPGTNPPRKLASQAAFPMLAAAPQGRGPVVVCWEGPRDGQQAIFVKSLDTFSSAP